MADQFPSTLLPQDNTPEQIQKANLDLLKKINTTAQGSADIINQIKSNQYQPQWQPYPAGAYVFPSGTQTVLAGVLPIGADTTAPTFGTGTTLKAWWRDNGKTIDIFWQILQSTLVGTVIGSGAYYFPMPLGKIMDTSFVTTTTSALPYAGTSFDGISIRAINAGNGYFTAMHTMAASTTLLFLSGSYLNSVGASGVFVWGSAGFAATSFNPLSVSGIITGIPIQ